MTRRLKHPAGNVEKKASRLDTLERVQVSDRLELRRWLDANHLTSPGIWLVTYRSVTGKPRPSYDEIVEELVSFGWIDSTLVKLDETQTMQLCTPRNPRSHWSASNKQRVARLTEQGLMKPRGLELVAEAKANGAWDYLEPVEALEEPPDFAARLDAADGARRHWAAFPASYRKSILYWIHTAKRPDTRRSRIDVAVSAAAANTRLTGGARAAVAESLRSTDDESA